MNNAPAAQRAAAHGRLTWRGVTDIVAGRPCVRLAPARCAGCTGSCGLGLFAPPRVFLNVDGRLPAGRPVEVVATARKFAGLALAVFGAPLAVALGAAIAVEALAWPDWWIAAAPLGAVAAMAGARAASSRAERPHAVECDSDLVRVRLD